MSTGAVPTAQSSSRHLERRPRRRLGSAAVAGLAAALATALAGTPALAAPRRAAHGTAVAHKAKGKKKRLSQANITVTGNYTADMLPAWVAENAGFFKKNGLNAQIVNSSGGSASGAIAAFIGNHEDFLLTATPTEMAARQAGEPVIAVYNVRRGGPFWITISSSVARAKGIPSAGSTPAQARKQLAALRRTHLTVAVTSLAAPAYDYAVAVFRQNGVSYGPNGDVTFVPVGNASAQQAAVEHGTTDALVNDPPTAVLPGTVTINLGLLPPVASADTLYAVTTVSFLRAHRDSVQAFVNALTEAWAWAHEHPTLAERISDAYNKTIDITDPTALSKIFHGDYDFWVGPSMTLGGFTTAERIANMGIKGSTLSVTYGQLVDNVFVKNALRQLPAYLRNKLPASLRRALRGG
ncbi:MAG TPA: ABC transporter substrate-binding protein [Acidimicrobiales bacterium]|nr:ABC transporter substrate-binding protein [Acidimicrobiales bacterium]